MVNDSYPVFPFYLVIDVSASMADCLAEINAELPALRDEIANDPIVGDIARFAIITFSEDASMALPLSDLLSVNAMPTLQVEGSTNYREVFEFLAGCIPHDMQWFKDEGYQVYRPAVFFITDGLPTDEGWEAAYQDMVDPSAPYRPNIVTFGFGDAEHSTLSYIATFKAYAAFDGQQPARILRTISQELTKSILASSRRAAAGEATIVMPEELHGMQELAVDMV